MDLPDKKTTQDKSRPFYGWVIVGFTLIVQFVTVGLSYYTFTAYLKPLTEALDSDRFAVSLTISIQMAVAALLSPLAGRLFAHKPVKLLMFIGLVFLSAGLLLTSQVTKLWHLYLVFGGLIATGVTFLGIIPCNLLLANWFDKRRGTAIGISQFGITISATALVPAVTWLMLAQGWETSFIITGLAAFVVLAPLIWLFAVKSPEEKGLFPDGIKPAVTTVVNAPSGQWNFARAIRNFDIWAITFIVGPCYFGIASIVLTMHSHATDLGFTAMQASAAIAATTFMGALAKPVMGTLSDLFSKKLVTGFAVCLQAVGVLLLITADGYYELIVAGAMFGLGYGGIAPLWAVLLATRFGRESFAQILGANMPMLTVFNITSLPVTTLIFEQTGSYMPAYTALLGGYAVALLALWLLKLEATPAQVTSN